MNKTIERLTEKNDEYLKLLEDVCSIETPSGDAVAVTKAIRLLGEHGKKNGLSVRYIDKFPEAGAAAVITLNRDDSVPPLILMAHIDTVHNVGAFGKEIVTYKDEWMHAPGVIDCKGGAVMALAILESMAACDTGKRTIKLLLTPDEEVSSKFSGLENFLEFVKEEAKGAEAAFNCEVGRFDKVVVGRKGIIKAEIIVRGMAAHAGNCATDGASAIKEMAYKILKLEENNGKEDITFNCGVISGGTKVNIVAEYCKMECDIRFFTEDSKEKAIKILEETVQSSTVDNTCGEYKIVSTRYSMPKTEGNVALAKRYCDVYKKLCGSEIEMIETCGGADSAYTTYMGIPTICALGPCGEGIHSVGEKMFIPSFLERAKVLTTLLLEF